MNFVDEIADLSKRDIDEAKKLIRPHARHYFVHDDQRRKSLLHELVDRMEKGADIDKYLQRWFSCVQVKI